MKNLKIVLIVFLSGITLFLCCILGITLSGGNGFSFYNQNIPENPGSYSLAQELEYKAGENGNTLESIHIDLGMNSHDVFFYQSDSDTLVIREYLNYTPKENQLCTVHEEDNGLVIRGKGSSFFSFSLFSFQSKGGYLEIYLPDLSESPLESLWVKTVSGQIYSEVPFTIGERFTVASTSGDISFPQVTAGTCQVSSTSGDIHFAKTAADTLAFATTSGDIFLEQTTGTTKCSTTSGEISLPRTNGDVTVTSTSGDIRLGTIDGGLSLTSTSGDISLQNATGRLSASTVSGDIQADCLNGDFQLHTTSGYLSLSDGAGCGKAGSVSGDIHIWLQELTGDLSVSTTSGFVDCKLPGDTSLFLDYKSVSGECSTFFDEVLSFSKKGNQAKGQYGPDPAWNMTVSSTSGDLRISEY